MIQRYEVLGIFLVLSALMLLGADARAGDAVPVRATQVSTAGYYGFTTCAVTTAGGVKCWGRNAGGQLGDGTRVDRGAPVDVVGLNSGIVQVVAGRSHSCALTNQGEVKCWGRNANGQLGNGTHVRSNTPVSVVGLTDATAISTGDYQTCAVTATGGVMCWGNTNYSYEYATPAPVAGLADVAAVSTTSESKSCALTSGGEVYCWHGARLLQHVLDLHDAVAIAVVGYFDACAVTSTGTVRCWDMSHYRGDSIDAPETVAGITDAISIEAGQHHTCVTTSAGAVQCWGYNWNGELGDGTTTDSWGTPVTVVGLTNAVDVTAGSRHSCAVTVSGEVKCWGSNANGQLGNGHLPQSALPVTPQTLGSGVASFASGDGYTCSLSALGTAKCWGDNRFGQLGDGSTTDHGSPVPVSVPVDGTWTMIAPGFAHTCAVTAIGGVKCWGDNRYGQLGDGSTMNSSTPVDVALAPTDYVEAIAIGDWHTCVLLTSGQVKCWGSNWSGQLGNGTQESSGTPILVSSLANDMVVALAAGFEHTCALIASGEVKCWGRNWLGQLGDGTTWDRHTPVTVIGLTDAVTIDAASGSTCAITAAGAVKCWGAGGATCLGNDALTPMPVPGLTDVVSVEVAVNHRCAQIVTGEVKCWGENSYGQLGNGSRTSSATPVTVQGLNGVVESISTRAWHTCALSLGGGLQCWGSNHSGQLGIGGPLGSLTPVYAVGFGDWNIIFQSGFEGSVGN